MRLPRATGNWPRVLTGQYLDVGVLTNYLDRKLSVEIYKAQDLRT